MTGPTSSAYAGDVDVREAWKILKENERAQLIDVRTAAEWAFVGLPDLGELHRPVHRVEWQTFPAMQVNADFVEQAKVLLDGVGASVETPILFLCRSGARSRAAAVAMTAAGFKRSFNIAAGFEGDADPSGHRGTVGGWKAAGLPWRQT
ncbi:MAG: rhodanese-like domain-containing protein [Alphaproteobacteria bacterium]|nr:rhodanese-like domain-containing protein [Alphaproteobacteria bacterium]